MNPYLIEIVSSTLLKTIVRITVKRLGFSKLLASSSNPNFKNVNQWWIQNYLCRGGDVTYL